MASRKEATLVPIAVVLETTTPRWLGISTSSNTVVSVMQGGWAQEVGVETGDEILAVDGNPVAVLEGCSSDLVAAHSLVVRAWVSPFDLDEAILRARGRHRAFTHDERHDEREEVASDAPTEICQTIASREPQEPNSAKRRVSRDADLAKLPQRNTRSTESSTAALQIGGEMYGSWAVEPTSVEEVCHSKAEKHVLSSSCDDAAKVPVQPFTKNPASPEESDRRAPEPNAGDPVVADQWVDAKGADLPDLLPPPEKRIHRDLTPEPEMGAPPESQPQLSFNRAVSQGGSRRNGLAEGLRTLRRQRRQKSETIDDHQLHDTTTDVVVGIPDKIHDTFTGGDEERTIPGLSSHCSGPGCSPCARGDGSLVQRISKELSQLPQSPSQQKQPHQHQQDKGQADDLQLQPIESTVQHASRLVKEIQETSFRPNSLADAVRTLRRERRGGRHNHSGGIPDACGNKTRPNRTQRTASAESRRKPSI